MTGENEEFAKECAEEITKALFSMGGDPGSECHRIAFMGGMYPHDEKQQGGMDKKSFHRWIETLLGELI